jgi:hypothetical protein
MKTIYITFLLAGLFLINANAQDPTIKSANQDYERFAYMRAIKSYYY